MDLTQLKLRPTKTNDRSKPVTNTEITNQSVSQYKDKIHAVNLENWYEQLKHLTFETQLFPLSISEAQALQSSYGVFKGKQAAITESESKLLESLEDKLNSAVTHYPDGAFVRLSTRSPKDAGLIADLTMQYYKEELAKQSEINENTRLICLVIATTLALKVQNGKEALTLIKVSERSNEDLTLALEFPSGWDMNVIVRRWETIHPSMEFRGFVCKKRLTALSQYFHIVFFPNLPPAKDQIQKKIQSFFESDVRDIIPLDNYIIDFGILDNGRMVVIELNPFSDFVGCGTDPGLFHWSKDRQVVDGDAPFEFRIREAPFDVLPAVELKWRDIISDKH